MIVLAKTLLALNASSGVWLAADVMSSGVCQTAVDVSMSVTG